MSNQKKRNILTITCDQLCPDFLHAYGADFVPTPNIDALAAEGVVFDNAITASTVCSPARMSFLTGLPVSGHDAWTNQIERKEGTELFTERLCEAGYTTATVGTYETEPLTDPAGYHYRKLFTFEGTGSEEHCDYCHELRRRYPELGDIYQWEEDGHYKFREEDFYDYWTADRAIEFIESYAKTGKAPNGAAAGEDAPFFLLCNFLSPHAPMTPPKEVAGTVDAEKIPPVYFDKPGSAISTVDLYRRAVGPTDILNNPELAREEFENYRLLYCELIVEVDRMIGRVVDALKRNGLYEDTTIILTADHGSCVYDHHIGSKGPWPYQGQLFIPMIISNDPRIARGTRSDALTGNLDVGATLLDVAGDERAFGLSRSMIGLANGEIPEREVNFSEFCDSCKTIVDKRYTFTYYPFTGETNLFDRAADPKELCDLSGRPEYAEIERKYLKDVIDMMVLTKGVRIEAHDLTPATRQGIEKKHPKFLETFDIAYPVASMETLENIRTAGLDAEYNEFCKNRPIKAHYGYYFKDE